MRSWPVESTIGRSSEKLRRSPLTEYWRAGNVTLRPLPLFRSHTAEPDQLQALERAAREVQLRIRQLANRISLFVRHDLDRHRALLRGRGRLQDRQRQARCPATASADRARRIVVAAMRLNGDGRAAGGRAGPTAAPRSGQRALPDAPNRCTCAMASASEWVMVSRDFLTRMLLGATRGAAVQPQLRRTAVAEHLDVLPQHAARMAGAERLHAGFLRGEAAGQRRDGIAAPRTIGDLSLREDAAEKALAVPLADVGDARNVGGVERPVL